MCYTNSAEGIVEESVLVQPWGSPVTCRVRKLFFFSGAIRGWSLLRVERRNTAFLVEYMCVIG